MDLGLDGKRAIVLAASAGLGRACAEELGREGCKLVIGARDGERLADTASSVGATGIPSDVSDAESLDEFFGAAIAELGGVDILVTNCGGPPAGETSALSDEDWQSAFDLVFMSVVRSCRRVVPLMREQGSGRIVCITSASAREPIPGLTLSNALRPAVAGYAKTLAHEVAKDGVLVHGVMPGSLLTNRAHELAEAAARTGEQTAEEVLQGIGSGIPLGRAGDPAELGRVVAFLASDACTFSTGDLIPVEGGELRSL